MRMSAGRGISTALTESSGGTLRVPIILAPMGGAAGPELAASVASAGGVGLIGSGGEPVSAKEAWQFLVLNTNTRTPTNLTLTSTPNSSTPGRLL